MVVNHFYINEGRRCAQTAIKCAVGNRNLSWEYLDAITGRKRDQITTPIQMAYGLQKMDISFIYPVKNSFLTINSHLLKGEIIKDFGEDNFNRLNFNFLEKARLGIINSRNYCKTDNLNLKEIKNLIKKRRVPICLINYDKYVNREDKKRGHYLIILDIKEDCVEIMDPGPFNASSNKIISRKRLEESLMQTPIDYGIVFI